MTDQEQIIALAELDGWSYADEPCEPQGWYKIVWYKIVGHKTLLVLPNYLTDLNAVNELEEKLPESLRDAYTTILHEIVGNEPFWWAIAHASACRRCEAILRATGKWKE